METCEADIFRRAFASMGTRFSIDLIAEIRFAEADDEIMRNLAAKAREGNLTADQEVTLRQYEVVADLLGILRSKVRISLQHERRDST